MVSTKFMLKPVTLLHAKLFSRSNSDTEYSIQYMGSLKSKLDVTGFIVSFTQ